MLARRLISSLTRKPIMAQFSTSTNALNTAETSANAEVIDTEKVQQEVYKSIGNELADERNKLFAVVYINGRQWKISNGDLISLEGNLPLCVGDEIKLEKILMIGGRNFSIFGRPLLHNHQAQVDAVVVEKKLKSPELKYTHINHRQTKIVKWISDETTILRIKNVSASGI
ncbi:unnamed protein product [Caenorhabditis bovis]|uniref:Large ribosomal subunit protein bL21m n=1 Tax=Caenorhabditis bovis TaxID=2654633 RepID=A0A8S1ENY4_9PELO|nr:unnamed protein product [Caenorhabditis bovis]